MSLKHFTCLGGCIGDMGTALATISIFGAPFLVFRCFRQDIYYIHSRCEIPDRPNLALCPTCHALYHRGTISADSMYAYKAMLVALSHAFDVESVDRLLFLNLCPNDFLVVSGDGLLFFARLIAAGLANVELKANNAWQLITYAVNISPKGKQLIDAWKQGDRTRLMSALG